MAAVERYQWSLIMILLLDLVIKVALLMMRLGQTNTTLEVRGRFRRLFNHI